MTEDVWVEDNWGEPIYIGPYEDMAPGFFSDFCLQIQGKMSDAEKSGWKNLKVSFESTLEPYEDCLPGPVQVSIVGLRKETEKELKERQVRAETQKLADKLGVSYYEASIVLDLKRRGKIP